MTKVEIMKLATFRTGEMLGEYANRLIPLIEALAESNEKLVEACRLVVKLWDADAPEDMTDELDVKLCREALANHKARMEKLNE